MADNKQVIVPQKIGLQLCCNYCGYSWIYTGRREYYATCPNCRLSVKLRRPKVQTQTKTKTQTQIDTERLVEEAEEDFES